MSRFSLGTLALLAALSVPFAASAQVQPGPGGAPNPPGIAAPGAHAHHRHGNRLMRAMRGLNLTDVQRQQIAAALRNARAGGRTADPQARRANMLALRRQIEGVLTDQQRTRFRANLAKHHHRQGPPPNGAAPHTAPQ